MDENPPSAEPSVIFTATYGLYAAVHVGHVLCPTYLALNSKR